MALKNFIKENFVLAAGLALPVLLIAVFLLSTTLPRHFATPPQYKLLLSAYDYNSGRESGYSVDYVVKEGKLFAKLTPKEKPHYGTYYRYLLVYDGQTDSLRKIDVELPEAGRHEKAVTLPVAEVAGMSIDMNSKAPDGYAFAQGRSGGGGIATEVFGGGYRYRSGYVKKGMVSYKLPQIDDSYHANVDFIGWITEEE